MHYVLTPSAGKRLIGKAVAEELSKASAIQSGTIVIIAGTTNGYVAEELLRKLNQHDGFARNRFFRGITTPPRIATSELGRLRDESEFPGDVVIENGVWRKGKTIFDALDSLKEGDIVVKGANCVDPVHKKAGILIRHPKGGTILAALQAIIGRRVRLVLPVGLEKRVSDDIDSIARLCNSPGGSGPRLLPVLGDIVTELEAIEYLFGVCARLIAAGGVAGAEGSVWIHIKEPTTGAEEIKQALDAIAGEEAFRL